MPLNMHMCLIEMSKHKTTTSISIFPRNPAEGGVSTHVMRLYDWQWVDPRVKLNGSNHVWSTEAFVKLKSRSSADQLFATGKAIVSFNNDAFSP